MDSVPFVLVCNGILVMVIKLCLHRVCITHAPRSGPAVAGVPQGQRATLKACPMGLLVTRVVANGSLAAGDDGVLDMTFPFTEPWPVSRRRCNITHDGSRDISRLHTSVAPGNSTGPGYVNYNIKNTHVLAGGGESEGGKTRW